MKTRIITAIVALAVFAAVLIAPPVVFTIALAAVIFFMLYECYSATKADTATKAIGFVSAVLIMAALYGISAALKYAFPLFAVAIVMIIVLYMILIVAEHGKNSYKEVLSNGFLTMYVVLSMGCAWLAKEVFGTAYMLLIFICAWSTDTFAYFTGKFLGKHKLIPHVSPNKTVEGSVGGVVGTMILSVIYLCTLNKALSLDINWLISGLAVGFVSGVFSQIGDLTASAIKRDTGIKDFGWIFPGHGGFMDRFDSVMFIAPFIFGILILTAYML